jgi:hypothetical protein
MHGARRETNEPVCKKRSFAQPWNYPVPMKNHRPNVVVLLLGMVAAVMIVLRLSLGEARLLWSASRLLD